MSWSALAVGTVVALVPLDTTATPVPVNPPQDAGFAYLTLLGGFFGVGLIMLLYVLVNLKPKRRQPYRGPND
jgi:uncharacterized membrane protein